jgi:hypothetical protein
VRAVIVGIEPRSDGYALVRDWEVVERLNRVLAERDPRRFRVQAAVESATVQADVDGARTWLATRLDELDLPFRVPDLNICCLILQGDRMLSSTEDNVGEEDA